MMFPAMPPDRYLIGKLPWYSVLIVTGILCALLLCTHEEKRRGLERDTVIDLALWVIPFGIIGARLYYVAFSFDLFRNDPLSILYVWQGGLAIYGGIIGGLAAIVLFCIRRKLPVLLMTDMIVPALALAQAIGRWGNYFNMEAYGAQIVNPAWQFFPIGVMIPTQSGYAWHMATFFYESTWNLLIFLLLWFVIRKRSKRHGTVTLWYMLLYGLGRMMIEGLRTDSLMIGPIRVSQLLSGILAACALLTLLILHLRNRVTDEKEV